MTMNRRQFLKNMGIGAAGAALPGVSMFAANEAMNPQDKSLFKLPELHCDVIVVGAGPAGIPAGPAPTTITSQCNSGNLNRDLSWGFIASFAANMETPGKAAPAAPIPMFFKNCLLFIVIVVRLFLF